MNSYLTRLLFIFLICCISLVTNAQKVALVLSGGGSKGVAHIGVIQALEENEIPIDYITGTSMGAIVGGLYASGYSPDEIATLVNSDEFDVWLSGEMVSNYRYSFKRDADNASWVTIKFDYDVGKDKLKTKLPTNIIAPYKMDFAFMELFSGSSAASDYNFDSLMIPYRCVASDIEARQAVVLSKGQLGNAIRASMTFPFLFKPLEIDGKLLFDGGMYNNFPSDIAIKDFQPDVIIGSKAAGNYDKPDPDDIISQIQNMLVARTDYDIVMESGVLIEHDLGDVNVIDFKNTPAFIDSGYVHAIQRMGEIKELVKERITGDELLQRRNAFKEKKPPLIIDSIRISGLTKGQTSYVSKLLRHKSDLRTLADIEEDYFGMVADDKIQQMHPQLEYNKSTGRYTLFLKVKPAERFQIQFGGNVSSTTANAAYVGLKYKYLGAQAIELGGNVYFGRFYSSAMAMTRIDFPSSPKTYLEGGFIYSNKNYFRSAAYFFEDITPAYLIDNESFFYLDLGMPIARNGRFAFGGALARTKYKYYQSNSFSRLDTADVTYFDYYSPQVLFELNSMNYKQYPNKGVRLLISANYVNGNEKNIPGSTSIDSDEFEARHQWVQFKLLYDNYFQRLGPFTFGFLGELLISNQELFNNYISTMMASPAFTPIPESQVLFLPTYRSHSYLAAGLKIISKLHQRIDLRVEGYLFQPYQEIIQNPDQSVSYGSEFEVRSVMATAAFVWHSPLGPLSLSANYYSQEVDQFTFFFNVGYIIFNRSAIE